MLLRCSFVAASLAAGLATLVALVSAWPLPLAVTAAPLLLGVLR